MFLKLAPSRLLVNLTLILNVLISMSACDGDPISVEPVSHLFGLVLIFSFKLRICCDRPSKGVKNTQGAQKHQARLHSVPRKTEIRRERENVLLYFFNLETTPHWEESHEWSI